MYIYYNNLTIYCECSSICAMKTGETKRSAFKRLASSRANKIVKNLHLLGNLSNKRNYDYTESDIKSVFGSIDDELRLARMRFLIALKKNKKIKL